MSDAIEQFLSMRSAQTARSYRCAIADFEKVASRELEQATVDDVMTWLHVLKMRRVSDNTLKSRFNSLKSVCSYLEDIGKLKVNPFRRARRSMSWRNNTQVRPTKFVPYDSVLKIINDALTDGGLCQGERTTNSALLAVMFGAGLRRNEARMLELSDVLKAPDGTPYLRLRKTKAGKDCDQPLPDWSWKYLLPLVELRRQEASHRCENYAQRLFVKRYDSGYRPLSESSIYRIFKKYVEPHCPGAAPHAARATACTRLKAMGYEDREVARFLRHGSTHMVEVYDKRIRQVTDNPGKRLSFE